MDAKKIALILFVAGLAGCGPQGHCGQMPHRFINAEQWAERFDAPERDAWQKPAEIAELMQIQPGMQIADVGAGTGYMLPYLSSKVGPNGRVVGIDIETQMVEYMQARIKKEALDNCEARVGQPDDPGLNEAQFQRALILNTWHHIAERETFAAKIKRGLSPGGQLYIVDYAPGAGGTGPMDWHRLPVDEVIAELESAGFAVTVLPETLAHHYVVQATVGALE